MNDILQVQGINSKGFGFIPKLVMQDKRLTTEAKAIYSYFCSYAGAGQTAFPSRSKIISDLRMSKSRFYKHFQLLKQCRYIQTEQEHKDGRYQRNIYTLIQEIQCIQNKDTVQCTQNECTEFECTQNKDTNNNSNKNNNTQNKQVYINNKQVIKNNSPSSLSANDDRLDEDTADETAKKIQNYTRLIKENISYSNFEISRPHQIRLLDEIISVMIDALVSDSKYVRIDGEEKPRTLVKSVLLELDYRRIEHVIDQFQSFTGRINKKRQFLLTMLYNSKMELDSHYTNLVKNDGF